MKEITVIATGALGVLFPLAQGTVDLMTVAKELGFPIAIIFMMGYAVLKVSRWLAPMIAGWGERLVASHEKLVDSNIQTSEVNTETLRKMETAFAAQTSVMHRMETTLNAAVEVKKRQANQGA